MCGIIGFVGKGSAGDMLLSGLERLEYRGYDSAGIALMDKGELSILKTTEGISALKSKAEKASCIGKVGIGHTRWATHGEPSLINAHPHTSYDGKIAVVHNGIIENYDALRKDLSAEGIEFKSDTDTEVIPNLIAKNYSGDLILAVLTAVKRLKGSYALGIICTEHPDTIIAVKQFSPLIVGIGEGESYLASDITAIVSHTKKVVFLDDGELAKLTPDGISVYRPDGNTAEKTVSHIYWDIAAAEKEGYEHFMLKEIYEQPRAVRETVESRIKNGEICLDEINLTAERLKAFNKINIVACGSAYHAGMAGKYILEGLLKIPVELELASEFRYRDPIVDSKTLTVIISQSGETADTLAALYEAKKRGSYILSIVNVVGSSIAKASDGVLYTRAGPEISVATTKGYTTQVSLLYLFAVWAARCLKTAKKTELDRILSDIRRLPEVIKEVLKQKDTFESLARRTAKEDSVFFIGRNVDYAASLEAALKLKEISYIHSTAFAAGELKHGSIALIEKGTLVFALACYKPLCEKMISNIKEVKARGGYVVACASKGTLDIGKASDECFLLPELHDLLLPLIEVVPFQLYAYFVAVFKGCNVDKPRNLAKSVTVE